MTDDDEPLETERPHIHFFDKLWFQIVAGECGELGVRQEAVETPEREHEKV